MEMDFSIRLTSRDDVLPLVTGRLTWLMEAGGFDPHSILEVQLAVEEACINILEHAYSGEAGLIYFSAHMEDGLKRLEIRIEDKGPPFDPTVQHPPTPPDSDLGSYPVGRWGIPILRKMVDVLTYERRGKRNILSMFKYLKSNRKI